MSNRGGRVALIQTRVCDRCHVKDDDLPVIPWKAQRGQAKIHGDLCIKCWDAMVKDFRAASIGRGRHQIVVVD